MIHAHLHLALMRHPAPNPRRHPRPDRAADRATIVRWRGPVTVRLAAPDDALELRRIAELDSAPLPVAPLLIGERAGRPVAAMSLSDGAVVANPFVPTADIVGLLKLRARQLARDEPSPGRRAIGWRLLRAIN